jgi:hypothetical protein
MQQKFEQLAANRGRQTGGREKGGGQTVQESGEGVRTDPVNARESTQPRKGLRPQGATL